MWKQHLLDNGGKEETVELSILGKNYLFSRVLYEKSSSEHNRYYFLNGNIDLGSPWKNDQDFISHIEYVETQQQVARYRSRNFPKYREGQIIEIMGHKAILDEVVVTGRKVIESKAHQIITRKSRKTPNHPYLVLSKVMFRPQLYCPFEDTVYHDTTLDMSGGYLKEMGKERVDFILSHNPDFRSSNWNVSYVDKAKVFQEEY